MASLEPPKKYLLKKTMIVLKKDEAYVFHSISACNNKLSNKMSRIARNYFAHVISLFYVVTVGP